MSAPRRTQAERRDETRRRLLGAAARVFARDGAGASVTDIASEAECSTGAIYQHFSGKDDLLAAVFDSGFPNWESGYADAVADASEPEQVIAALARHWQQLLDDDPMQAQLYIEFWMASRRDPVLQEAFRARQGRIVDSMSALIASQLQTYGIESAIDTTTLGSIITALADGLALQHLSGASDDAANTMKVAIALLLSAAAVQGSQPGDGKTGQHAP